MAFVRLCLIAAFTPWFGYCTQASVAKTTGLPSLKFHFTLKRSSMKAQGLTEISVFANPSVLDGGDTVLYDAFSSYSEHDTVHNYYLVNGIGVSSSFSKSCAEKMTIQCQDSPLDEIPPISAIISGLNEAIAVPSAAETSQSPVECPNGNVFQVKVNNTDFALCMSDSLGFTMQGSDMDVKVEYLEARLNITIPTPTSELKCDTVAIRSSITQIGKYLLTGKRIQGNARSLKAAIDLSLTGSSSCSCKSKRRPCVFIHGLGRKDEKPENQDSDPDYWGDHLPEHTPCCSSVKFARLNTINDPWTDRSHQQKVCDRVLAVNENSTDVKIVDTIVITHSLGGLMLAGALANELCTLDSSSSWVALAAPMMGSGAADYVQESCDGNFSVVATEFGELAGICPPYPALKAVSYQGGDYSSKSLDAAYVAAQKAFQANVYATICSKTSSGLLSFRQIGFWALGKLLPHHSDKNDGMVDFESCAGGIPISKFGETWRDRFYLTKLNHSDMKLVFRDSRWNEAKMPRKWFECLL